MMWSSLLKTSVVMHVMFVVWADDHDLPAMNVCAYDDAPTAKYLNCLVEKVDKDVVEKTLSSIRDLFPDSSYLDILRYVCKANNDEGHVIIDAIMDNLSEDEAGRAAPKVWYCHDNYLVT